MLGIGHVHLKVSNLKRAEEFYKKLGFKVNERVNGYLFLTLGKKHHDLALQDIGSNAKNQHKILLDYIILQLKPKTLRN